MTGLKAASRAIARGVGIDFDHVHVHHSEDRAGPGLESFPMSIEAPEIVSIVGPSGGGKTTEISMTGGSPQRRAELVRPDCHEVEQHLRRQGQRAEDRRMIDDEVAAGA